MMNIQKMMQQAQEVQTKLAEMQEKFRDIEVTGESGGGLVRVTMTCDGTMKGVHIEPNLIDPDDKETMEDLIVAAINNAGQARDAKVQEETAAMMEKMGLPAGAAGSLPF